MLQIKKEEKITEVDHYLEANGIGSQILYTGNETYEDIDRFLIKQKREGKNIQFIVVQEGIYFKREKNMEKKPVWTHMLQRFFKKLKVQKI